jgi:hypothetical protein
VSGECLLGLALRHQPVLKSVEEALREALVTDHRNVVLAG